MDCSKDLLEIVQKGEDGELILMQETVEAIKACKTESVSIKILTILTDLSEDFFANAKTIVKHLHNFLSKSEGPSTNGGNITLSSEEPDSSNGDHMLSRYCKFAELILQEKNEVTHCEPTAETVIKNFIQAAAAVKQVAESVTSDAGPAQKPNEPEQQKYGSPGKQTASNKGILCWPEVLTMGEEDRRHILIFLVDINSFRENSKLDAFANAISSFKFSLRFPEMKEDKIRNVIFTNECLSTVKSHLEKSYPDSLPGTTPCTLKMSKRRSVAEKHPSLQKPSKIPTPLTKTVITQAPACSNSKEMDLGNLSEVLCQSIFDSNSHCQNRIPNTLGLETGENMIKTPSNNTLVTISKSVSFISKPPPPVRSKRHQVQLERARKDIIDKNWHSLKEPLEGWIDSTFNIENIDEIDKVSLSVVANMKESEIIKKTLIERVTVVKQALKDYLAAGVGEHIGSAIDLENISESEIALTIPHPECSSLIFRAVQKIHSTLVISRNSQLCDSIVTTCITNMRQFYAETFLCQLETLKLRNMSGILQMHSELVHDIVTTFEHVVCRLGLHKDKLTRTNELMQMLDNDFYLAIGQLNIKLQRQVKQVQSLIDDQRAKYEASMDLVVETTETIEASRLAQEHETFVESCSKFFQATMTETFDKDEPLDSHISALHFYFDKSYKSYGGEIKSTASDNKKKEVPKSPIHSEPKKPETPKTPEVNLCSELPENKGTSLASDGIMPVTNEPQTCSSNNVVLLDISHSRLGISSQLDEDFAQEDVQYFSDGIAITQHEEWILLDEIERSTDSTSLPTKQIWNLRDCWEGFENIVWSRTVPIHGSNQYIGIEFLLSVWIKLVFRKYFGGSSIIINEALIGVPIWFTSLHRQQVLHAIKILGIGSCTLVNENSASAYFLYKRLSFPNYNVAVLSENSGKIDMALFCCNQQSKQVGMIAHHGDYYEPSVVKNGGYLTRMFTQSNLRHSGSQKENILKGFWNKVLQQTEQTYYGLKLNIEKVVIKSESTEKAELLFNFAKLHIASARSIILNNNSALSGLAEISRSASYRHHKTTETFIRDISAFDVVCKTSIDQEVSNVFPRQSTNSNVTMDLTIHKKSKSESATLTLCQQHKGVSTDLGSLTIKNPSKSNLKIKVSVQSLVDGRLTLLPVKYAFDNRAFKFSGPDPKTEEAHWESSTAKQDALENYALFVENLTFFDKVFYEAKNYSKGAIIKCKVAMQKLQKNPAVLKSQEGQNQVLKLLEHSISAIENSHDISEIKSQSDFIDQICETYKLQ